MYTLFFLLLCILVGFYKIGELDEEIGRLLGLATGCIICIVALVFPAGYLRVGLYAVGGFVFLTVYKIIRGMAGNDKDETEPRD